jgi:hypothetical protein
VTSWTLGRRSALGWAAAFSVTCSAQVCAAPFSVGGTILPNVIVTASGPAFSHSFDLLAQGYNPATDVIFVQSLFVDAHDDEVGLPPVIPGDPSEFVRVTADGVVLGTYDLPAAVDNSKTFPFSPGLVETDGRLDVQIEATAGDFELDQVTLNISGLRNPEQRTRQTLSAQIAPAALLDENGTASFSGVLDLGPAGFAPDTFEIFSLSFTVFLDAPDAIGVSRVAQITADGQMFISDRSGLGDDFETNFPLLIGSVQPDGRVDLTVTALDGSFTLANAGLTVTGAQVVANSVPEPALLGASSLGLLLLCCARAKSARQRR